MIKLIDFYADWCGPCKIMAPIFEEIEGDYQGKIQFQKSDVEAESDLASKFNIMSIPTFVALKDDKEIDRRTGAMPKEMLKTWLNSLLN
ncbi:thioredoxin [candidate division WWE3 bacterium]|uniref:Thioredoxin n=1 Tax=candidate division WWE3 bacterium TaxID=2053526 RepID=A0A7X9HTT8_UNCKA|nr:thioredoxin [candidate division WWE3 bacterium]